MALDSSGWFGVATGLLTFVAVIFQFILLVSSPDKGPAFYEIVRLDPNPAGLGPALFMGLTRTCSLENNTSPWPSACMPVGIYNTSVMAPVNTTIPDALSFSPPPAIAFTSIALALNLLLMMAIGADIREPLKSVPIYKAFSCFSLLAFFIFFVVVITTYYWFAKSAGLVRDALQKTRSPPLGLYPGQGFPLAWTAVGFMLPAIVYWLYRWSETVQDMKHKDKKTSDDSADKIKGLEEQVKKLKLQLYARHHRDCACRCEQTTLDVHATDAIRAVMEA